MKRSGEKLTFGFKKSKAVSDRVVAKRGAQWELRSESNSIFHFIQVLIRLCITQFNLSSQNMPRHIIWPLMHQQKVCKTAFILNPESKIWDSICRRPAKEGLAFCGSAGAQSLALPSQKWTLRTKKPLMIYFIKHPTFICPFVRGAIKGWRGCYVINLSTDTARGWPVKDKMPRRHNCRPILNVKCGGSCRSHDVEQRLKCNDFWISLVIKHRDLLLCRQAVFTWLSLSHVCGWRNELVV